MGEVEKRREGRGDEREVEESVGKIREGGGSISGK